MRRLFLLLALALLATLPALAQPSAPNARIRINQVGFHPDLPKVAAVVDAPGTAFHVLTPNLADTVYSGTLGAVATWAPSQESVRLADFSGLTAPGLYVLAVPGLGTSYPFEIREHVFQHLTRAAIKSYYYQRASTALHAAHAGPWARAAGHPDTRVLIHPSAATPQRPASPRFSISSPKGWYDAGDYNKYVVNSGISTGTLLSLYEHHPEYFDALTLNIPESGNGVPDLLDEVLWNVRWMLTMQDPNDGGVYHKLTNPSFDGDVMPSAARSSRYVVQKSTAATLDFAAVMAQGARIFAAFPEALPGLSDSLLTAAVDAWRWSRSNPAVYYRQGSETDSRTGDLNDLYDPDIHTGEYGDGNVSDEFLWAAAELYVTTRADSFLARHDPFTMPWLDVPGWPSVRTMGAYSILHNRDRLTPAADVAALERKLLDLATQLANRVRTSAYGIVMGSGDFYWGSNSVAANQSMALLQAFRLTQDSLYLNATVSNLDYLLGRNATGYSFVTGVGDRTPMHPHHRASIADGVPDPVPGFLVGGPNPGREDQSGCPGYPSTLPARSYLDDKCSYASNEVAINWNAPLSYVAGALEALLAPSGLPTDTEEEAAPPPAEGSESTLRVFPNPMRATGTAALSLDAPSVVSMAIYDAIGRQVARPLDAMHLPAGVHHEPLASSALPNGLYFCRVTIDGTSRTTAFVVAR